MARQEIIQKPIVKVVDDYDGADLPDHTKPVRYQFNGRTFDLYLSDASRKAVDAFIEDLTDGAEQIGSSGRGDRIKAPHTIHDLRKWARENGHKVSPNRRAPGKVIRAFNDAH
ncbi:Lsr2 family DNA-binding protein [Aeromicrobium sp.]|uniref:Lsr2 family DNA-binding protein n=1 Tax=Aeromicrobium sp. TaxID=1871063 RepID=UPI003C534F74